MASYTYRRQDAVGGGGLDAHLELLVFLCQFAAELLKLLLHRI